MMLLPLLANAEAVEINGIYYNLSIETKTAEVTNYYKNTYSGEIVIPESVIYEGTSYSVTSIRYLAFAYSSGLTSIEIPSSVTSIGPSAFDRCEGLMGVYISDIAAWCKISFSGESSNPLHYARHLFLNGVEVKDLVIPNSVTSIGSWAFDGCLDLTSVIIPNSVKEIGTSTFSSCGNLITIKVENGNPIYDSRDDCNAIIRTADNELIAGCSNTIIPSSVTSIGESAFYGCSGLTSITIPNSVTSIGSYAFSYCTSLPIIDNCRYADTYLIEVVDKTIATCTIKEGTRFIGSSAFWDCSNLATVTIPKSVTSISYRVFVECDNLKTIKVENGNTIYDSRNDCNAIIKTADNELIAGCSNTIIPNSVTSIGYGAFYWCHGLTSIEIPNSVTSIGDNAFRHCYNLTSIEIPNSVTSIGSMAFLECSGLTSIEIPNSVTSIGNSAFSGCSGLTSIIIGNSVTSIGDYAFANSSGLKFITSQIEEPFAISDNVFSYLNYDNAILNVPAGTESKYEATDGWKNFKNIVKIDLSPHIIFADAKVKEICVENWDVNRDGELSYDEAATVVNLNWAFRSKGITYFNELQYFTGLKRIRFLDFASCKQLTSIIIPNSVKSIEDAAFEKCPHLTTITIPNSVTSIKGLVFYGCTSLTSVISYIKEPFAIDDEVFYTIYDENTDTDYFTTATLYVPTGTKAKYETTDGWKNFKNIVEMELQPVDNGQTIDFSTDIDESTNLNGSIMDNVFVNVNNGDGSYDPSEGCIIVSKPTDDSAIDGKEIFGEDFKDNYTGIVFKLAPGEGTIKVEAQTTGNMVLKVKIGDGMPITMELEGKLKVSFPYNVSEDTYVYIYGGLNTSNNAKGMRKAESADGTLKIYGIEVDSKANDIESLEVSQDDIATIYNLNGHRINSLQRGINIIRMNDGTVRKVVVK